jgi:hypothetical protein
MDAASISVWQRVGFDTANHATKLKKKLGLKMARIKKKRVKAYTPRPAGIGALNAALTSQHALDTAAQDELIDNARAALDAMMTDAQPTLVTLKTIKTALEIAARLTDTAVGGADYLDVIEDALRSCAHCEVRRACGQPMRFTGDEVRLVREGLDLHDALVQVASCGDMREAVKFLKQYQYKANWMAA